MFILLPLACKTIKGFSDNLPMRKNPSNYFIFINKNRLGEIIKYMKKN